jgi:polyhydroxybutyrate depolymerase
MSLTRKDNTAVRPPTRFAMLALLAASASAAFAQDVRSSLVVGGRERTYRLHVPPSGGEAKLPLVIVLHGGGGNGENAARMAQMDGRADHEKFFVVYPDGTGPVKGRLRTWSTWNCCGYALNENVDDVAFIRELIRRLRDQYPIDRKRIYAAGLSNGAMLAHRLGCELADEIAAIAPVAGALNSETCAPSEPVSVIVFHGTADEHVLYEGGMGVKQFPGAKPRVDRPVSHAVSTWARVDGCAPVPQTETMGTVTKRAYASCRNGSEVVLYTIAGQGHAWPGGVPGIGNGNVDPPTREISATNLMVDFFLAHPKR